MFALCSSTNISPTSILYLLYLWANLFSLFMTSGTKASEQWLFVRSTTEKGYYGEYIVLNWGEKNCSDSVFCQISISSISYLVSIFKNCKIL